MKRIGLGAVAVAFTATAMALTTRSAAQAVGQTYVYSAAPVASEPLLQENDDPHRPW